MSHSLRFSAAFCFMFVLPGITKQNGGPSTDTFSESAWSKVKEAIQILNSSDRLFLEREHIEQMVPRLHLGLLELWLQFRNFQLENRQKWKKADKAGSRNEMLSQEWRSEISAVKNGISFEIKTITEKITALQDQLNHLQKTAEGNKNEMQMNNLMASVEAALISQSVASKDWDMKINSAEKGECQTQALKLNSLGQQLSDLTQVVNGHTELLVELYNRLSVLEVIELSNQRSAELEGSADKA